MAQFNIILAGCGSMANEWVRYTKSRSDASIAALVDISEENAKALAEKHEMDVPIYRGITEALDRTNANLVYDITIPKAHREIVTKAMAQGCAVFGEKPMAESLEDAKAMVEAAQNLEKHYSVMQNRRYLKQIRSLRELLAKDTLGPLGFVCADFFLGPHFGGFRDLMDSPLILDMAIHTFDQARFITGADPVSVYCHEFNPSGSWYKGNAAAACIFEMSDGSVFCYRGSWCAEGFPTSWESEWRITGSKGTALWDGASLPTCEVVVPSDEQGFNSELEQIPGNDTWDGREGHYGCLDEMFAALAEGRKAETDCADNIKSMAMVFGAIQSAREGKKIALI